MPKKSSGNKKGIRKGIPKHKLRPKAPDQNAVVSDEKSDQEKLLSKLGRTSYDTIFRSCEYFHLISYRRLENGSIAIMRDNKHLYIHYLVISLLTIHLVCISYVLIWELLFTPVGMYTLLCVTNFLVYSASGSIFLVATFNSQEIVDNLNSWPQFLSCAKRKTDGKEPKCV